MGSDEHERLLAEIEKLMDRGERRVKKRQHWT